MYKISDIAELLEVEKTEVFEKMISHKVLLDPNIQKIEGVTYFNERGLDILKTLFSKKLLNTSYHENDVHIDNINHFNEAKPKKNLSKFEREREILYDKIEILKNELFNLDSELELKDEMIEKYQNKLTEDLESINKFQYTIMKKYEKIVE